ncbi:hypothetical protein DFH28DRAFT_1148873 [Melampsora americana]|nr:hypothetical protein DFH28DRAFT_1148873 [Melampsora americana]
MPMHNRGYPLTITPLDSMNLLPFPPEGRKRTGLVCESPKCSHRPPHSTVYYEPANYPRNIGLRCTYDKTRYRTYNLEWFQSEILNYNTELNLSRFLPVGNQLRLPPPIIAPPPRASQLIADQIARDHAMAMNLNNMLNGPGGPPSPPPTQQPRIQNQLPSSQKARGAFLTGSQRCGGVNGQTAVGHNPKNNSKCPSKLCFECCYQFNKGTNVCHKHSTAARRKYGLTPATQPAQGGSSRHISATTDSHCTPEPRIPQAKHLFSQGVESTSLTRFRSITIHEQANERLAKEGDEKVNKTITLVVWPGTDPDPLACKVWRVLAPEWPKFALDHSAQLKKEVNNVLGADFNDCVQVWNGDEKLWVLLEMETLERYHKDNRKILVAFPGVDPTKCKTVDTHLASISKSLAIDSRHMLHPAHQGVATPPTKSTSPQPDTPMASQSGIDEDDDRVATPRAHTPDIEIITSESDELATPRQASFKRKRVRESSEDQDESDHEGPRWPHGVTMTQMLKFYRLTVGPTLMINKKAWKAVFGRTHRSYVVSTVSKYQRWLDNITEPQLASYVANNGEKSVQQGLRRFKANWEFVVNANNAPKKQKVSKRFGMSDADEE